MTKKKNPGAVRGGNPGSIQNDTARDYGRKRKRTTSESKANWIAFLRDAFAGRAKGFISVTAITPDGPTETRSAALADIDSLDAFIKSHNGKRNLYWSVNRLRTKLGKKALKSDVGWLDFLHVDIDPRDNEPLATERTRIKKLIDGFEPNANIVIDSGAGFGAFWRIADPPTVDRTNIEEFETFNKRLALALGGDNCHNIDRIMRLPGTTNLPTKTKLAKGREVYQSTLVHCDDGTYDLDAFDNLPSIEEPINGKYKFNSSIPLRIVALADRVPLLRKRLSGETTGLNDTSRSGLDISVVSLLSKQRCFPDEIKATLIAYGHGRIADEKNADAYLKRMLDKVGYKPIEEPDGFNPKGIMSTALDGKEFTEIRWIIPQILPEGLAVLAGRPKGGKSRLALNWGMSASLGGKAFRSIQVEQCDVAMLSLEDSERRLQARQREINAHSEHLEYFVKWKRGDVAALETYLDAHPDVRLVTIDTWGRFSPKSKDKNATAYEVDVDNLGALQSVAMDRRICILLIMHTRKSEAMDVMDEILGSTGISGTADTLLVLKRPRGETMATLHVTGRDVPEEAYALEWDQMLFCWKLKGKAREVFVSQARQEVIDILRANKGGLTPSRLGMLLGGKTRQAAFKLLTPLINDGLIKDIDGKYFWVAPDGSTT